jgi:hypothetical protein
VENTYSYDMAGQLTDITHANGGTVLARSAYTLDGLGRRTAQTREDGITETYGYRRAEGIWAFFVSAWLR